MRWRSSVSRQLAASPADVWAILSDLTRFDEWLTVHDGWVGELPSRLAVGVELREHSTVFSMSNTIDWTVTACAPPAELRMTGIGIGGVVVSFALRVQQNARRGSSTVDGNGGAAVGSRVTFETSFSGEALGRSTGTAVECATTTEMHVSLTRLQALLDS